MKHKELDNYINQIVPIIKEYRDGELFYPLDEAHVERWIHQFDPSEHEIILRETLILLQKCYFSKRCINLFLEEIIATEDLWCKGNIANELSTTQFLSIQNKGGSQALLLNTLNNLIEEKFNQNIITNQSENTDHYIYIDDCLFSGNTLRRDLENWILNANEGSRLDIIYLASYSSGKYYIANKVLNHLCDQKGIQFNIWTKIMLNNFTNDWYNYDCLRPKSIDNENVNNFILRLNEQAQQNGRAIRLFREKEYYSPLFSDNRSREIFEQAMLKAGAYIYSCCASPNTSMKPMGYDFFNSLGFGAFFATYNNISNNSPLAFWWGDPLVSNSHPFSKWYPLLPRKVNDNGLNWF